MEDIPARNGDPFVSLASRSVVNQFAFANNCGIPLGMLVNCVSPQEAAAPTVERAPTRCIECGAFMNVWCTVGVAAKAGKWKCCFCDHINDGPLNLDTTFTELRHDAVMFVQDWPGRFAFSPKPAARRPTSPAPEQLSSKDQPNSNPAVESEGTPAVQSNGTPGIGFNGAPAVQFNGVPAGAPPSNSAAPAQPTEPDAPRFPHLALLFDTTLDDVSMSNAQSAVIGLLQALHPGTQVSLLTYGASVAVFDLAAEAASGCVLPGRVLPDDAMLKHALQGVGRHSAPLSECSSSAETIISSLRPHAASVPGPERKRCMGSAIEVALHIIRRNTSQNYSLSDGSQQRRSLQARGWQSDRILVVAGGTPTYGPGTIPVDMLDTHTAGSADAAIWKQGMAFFSRLGHLAGSQNTIVDIFAPDVSSFNVPLCLELVHPCGGEFVVHHEFGPMFQLALLAAVNRQFGTFATLDMYASRGLRVSQVMGSVGPLPERLRSIYSSNACSISSLETGRGVGICLEVLRDLTVERIFLQVVLVWTNALGQLVTRVVTSCLRVVRTAKEFTQSINPYVAGTLLAKKLILEGHKAGAAFDKRKMEELRLSCGAQLGHMARRFGTLKSISSGFLGFGAKQVFIWPAHLIPLASALYYLQRSPLLLPSLCPPAARMVLTKLFLRSSFESARHLVHPRLYEYSPLLHSFQEIPPADLALTSTSILLLDSGPTFFFWIGAHSNSSSPNSSTNPTRETHMPTVHDPPTATFSLPAFSLPSSSLPPSPTAVLPQAQNSTPTPTNTPLATTHPLPSSPSHPATLQAVFEDFQHFATMLSAGRFPVPDVHVVHQHAEEDGSLPNSLWSLILRLVPVHLDELVERQQQYPHHGDVGTLEEVKGAGRTQCGESFIGWCREQGVEVLG